MMSLPLMKLSPLPRHPHPMANDQGMILLAALLVLMALCILGAMALITTRYELALSGNDKLIARLKIQAESTAASAAERLENLPRARLRNNGWTSPNRLPWLSRGTDDQFDTVSDSSKHQGLNDYINDLSNWVDRNDAPSNCARLRPDAHDAGNEPFIVKFPDCLFQVIDVEVAQGSSLQTGNNLSTMHNLYVSGVARQGNAKRMVQIGYRKMY